MNEGKRKLTMAQPETYEIKVPSELDASWVDSTDQMTLICDSLGGGPPVTTLIGTLDQAELHGLLRRLYSMGLPLSSVTWMESQRQIYIHSEFSLTLS